MKKIIITCFIFISLFSSAQKFNTIYEQLVFVNEQWKNQPDVDVSLKQAPAKFLNSTELIQQHLEQVEFLLKNRNVNSLTDEQKKQRLKNIEILHGYRIAGIFPINDLHGNRQPYFIDKNNTFCAVGFLMKNTGAEKIAREIDASQKFSYVLDIHHPQLMNWVENSGLTLKELALIQPGYGGEVPALMTEMHYNNIGTDINEYIEIRQSTGALTGMPYFDSVIFADKNGAVYKRLAKTDMAAFNFQSYYYYTFNSGESFSDSGTVTIKTVSNSLLSVITYNSTGVSIQQWPFGSNSSSSNTTTNYSIGENETTPIGNSLNFCGLYGNSSWTLSSTSNTIATPNPCASFPTPVTFGRINYTIQDKNIKINWETVTENNAKEFEIEKSDDGFNFYSIGTIPAKGNSNALVPYFFVDNNPNYINHYKIKQVDLDGKNTSSSILFVKFLNAHPIKIMQNPVKEILQFTVTDNAKGEANIYTVNGSKILHQENLFPNNSIKIQHLSKGTYLLQVVLSTGKVYQQLFTKE